MTAADPGLVATTAVPKTATTPTAPNARSATPLAVWSSATKGQIGRPGDDQTEPEPPMLTRLLTEPAATPRDERVQDGTTLRHPPSLKDW